MFQFQEQNTMSNRLAPQKALLAHIFLALARRYLIDSCDAAFRLQKSFTIARSFFSAPRFRLVSLS
jgi:hypothetical protein